MPKFICPATFGGESATWTAYVAVEAESQEKVYSDLTDAIKALVEARKAIVGGEQYDDPKWQSIKALTEVTICGSLFDLSAYVFLGHGKDGWQMLEPDVIPLDEWFEAQKTGAC